MVVEAKEPVIWTKPADLVFPKAKGKLPPLGGLFKNGFLILLCDGDVRMLPPNPDAMLLRAIITPQGGEVIPNDE